MKRLAFITLLIGFLLSSCSVGYTVNIHQDGSAFVRTIVDSDKSTLTRYSQADLIYNIDTNGYQIEFEIKNIDSLGYYLPTIYPDFFRFRVDSGKLIITDGYTKPFRNDNPFCCAVYMQIKFDNDIIVKSANRSARQDGKKSILIKRTRRQLLKGKRKTDVVISMETERKKQKSK